MDSTFKNQEKTKKELLLRLKRIEGQVRGVIRMLDDERSCGEVVTQLGAIKAAVNRAGFTMLACHLAQSIEEDRLAGRDMEETMENFKSILKKFP